MSKFYMTDDEIRQSFTGARDQKKQARILAEMNLVSHAEMMDKLVSLGLANGEPLVGKTHGRKKSTPEIDEAFARALIEKDVPDEQIAKHFGVGISTFNAWRREKGIMRYPTKRGARKTVKEFQEMGAKEKQKCENTETMPAETSPAAVDVDGLTVEKMAALFSNISKLGQAARVFVGGKPVRAAFVNLKFDGSSDDPTDMSVELET